MDYNSAQELFDSYIYSDNVTDRSFAARFTRSLKTLKFLANDESLYVVFSTILNPLATEEIYLICKSRAFTSKLL